MRATCQAPARPVGYSDTTSVLLELSGVAEEGQNRSEGDTGTSRPTGGPGGPPREGLVASYKREVGTERAPGKVSGGCNTTLAPASGPPLL